MCKTWGGYFLRKLISTYASFRVFRVLRFYIDYGLRHTLHEWCGLSRSLIVVYGR